MSDFESEEEYADYYARVMDDLLDPFGPYPAEYSKKPISDDAPQIHIDASHHPECEFDGANPDTCDCRGLYNRDYEREREEEIDELHQEYWG